MITALQEARFRKKLLQKDVARALNIDYTYYSKIDRGERVPSLKIANKIASYFDIDVRCVLFPLRYMRPDYPKAC
jgi:putative transcriptional regulator